MKKTLFFVLVVFGLFANSFAQRPELFKEIIPKSPINWDAGSVEFRIVQNGWFDTGLKEYSKHVQTALLTEMFMSEVGVQVSRTTQEMIEEGLRRGQMVNDDSIDTSSSRFDKRNQKPAKWLVEATFSGTNSGSSYKEYWYKDKRVTTEYGSSEAWIFLTIIDYETGLTIAQIKGYNKYESTNLELTKVLDSLWGYGFNRGAGYSSQDSDPNYRRARVSTPRAYESLRGELRKLILPSGDSR